LPLLLIQTPDLCSLSKTNSKLRIRNSTSINRLWFHVVYVGKVH